VIVDSVRDIPDGFAPGPMAPPRGVLLCPPDHFDVVDVKNPFMEGRAGTVDRERAREQWEALGAAFRRAGLEVETLEPVAGCEDMVFTANPSFTGPGVFVPARMRHPSRQREVEAHARWLEAHGYERIEIAADPYEGGGDTLWHPERSLLWCGCGPRTTRDAFPALAKRLDVPVVRVELATEEFYHLDTCLCPLDARTALVYPPALAPEGLALVRALFDRVVELDEGDARERLCGNAAACPNRAVILQAGCDALERELKDLGFTPRPVETGEFLKSGGSAYCMKQWLW